MGLVYLVVGRACVLTVGRWLLPARAGPVDLSEKYDVRSFVTELRVQDDSDLVEVLIPPGSPLTGRLLSNLGFSPRLGVTVLALQRSARVRRRLARVRLQEGDLLLVHGPLEALMLFTRCVRLEEMYREMDRMVVFLLAGLIPLGVAMENTGAAAWLVDGVAGVLAPLPAVVVVGGLYLLTSVLTEIVMVYGPWGYRSTDFLRVGAPLNLLLLVVAALLIPVFWGG